MQSGFANTVMPTIEALGSWNPLLVVYVGQVVGAGQLHRRGVSRVFAIKLQDILMSPCLL